VGDLEERGGTGIDRTVAHHHGIVRGKRLELVGRAGEGQSRELGDACRYLLRKTLGGVEARTDGRAALSPLHEIRPRREEGLDTTAHLRCVTGEFLPQ